MFTFPRTFDGVDTTQLKVKLLDVVGGCLNCKVYENLVELTQSVDVAHLVGPFADKYENLLCIRFETRAACEYLSQ